MTSGGDDPVRDGALDVPAATVPTNRGDRRRAYGALAAVVFVIGAALGLRVVTDGSIAGVAATPRESAGPAVAATAAPTPTRPPASPRPQTVERLPDIANIALRGAGQVLLVARRGTEAALLAWSPGDADVVLERTFANAFSGAELPQLTSLAPDGRSLLVFSIADFDEAGKDQVILFDEGGHRAWERTDVTALSLAAWSDDSSRIALLGRRGTWILAVRDGSTYKDRVVVIPDDPASGPSGPIPPYDERILPVGFSDDGAWAYGAHQSVTRGMAAPFIRVAVATGAVERVDSLPMLGRSGPFRDGSGRSIGFTLDASTPGGPPSLAVIESDGSTAFRIAADRLMGLAFAADGSVLVLEGQEFDPVGRVRLVAYDRAGRTGEPLLDVGPVTTAALLGTQGGYAAVVLSTTSPERTGQLVVIRLGDRVMSAARLPADDASALVGASWLAGS